jgi:hypothetical protein
MDPKERRNSLPEPYSSVFGAIESVVSFFFFHDDQFSASLPLDPKTCPAILQTLD